ncbi:MAG: hypothetical protein WB709_09250 [Solirubrobacteraceae bacterium]
MARELHWELVAAPSKEFKDELHAKLETARSEGFTEPLHVSHAISVINGPNGQTPITSVLPVLGRDDE